MPVTRYITECEWEIFHTNDEHWDFVCIMTIFFEEFVYCLNFESIVRIQMQIYVFHNSTLYFEHFNCNEKTNKYISLRCGSKIFKTVCNHFLQNLKKRSRNTKMAIVLTSHWEYKPASIAYFPRGCWRIFTIVYYWAT